MKVPWELLLWIGGLGAIGGLSNCLLAGEFVMPEYDKDAKVWKPGWLGNVVVGGVAAIVVWGIYGPLASFDLTNTLDPHITLSQLLSSLVVGIGGARILSLEAQKMLLKSENEAERGAKLNLVRTLEDSLPREEVE